MTIQCCGVRLRTTCCSRLRRFLLSFTRYGDSFPRTRLLHHNWSCGWRGEQTSIDSYFHALSISDRYFPDAALVARISPQLLTSECLPPVKSEFMPSCPLEYEPPPPAALEPTVANPPRCGARMPRAPSTRRLGRHQLDAVHRWLCEVRQPWCENSRSHQSPR